MAIWVPLSDKCAHFVFFPCSDLALVRSGSFAKTAD